MLDSGSDSVDLGSSIDGSEGGSVDLASPGSIDGGSVDSSVVFRIDGGGVIILASGGGKGG